MYNQMYFFPNFVNDMTEDEISAARAGLMGICRSKNELFNIGNVKVVSRYADCTMFKCPACKRTHDDRIQMGSSDFNVRNGYTVIDPEMINNIFPNFN